LSLNKILVQSDQNFYLGVNIYIYIYNVFFWARLGGSNEPLGLAVAAPMTSTLLLVYILFYVDIIS